VVIQVEVVGMVAAVVVVVVDLVDLVDLVHLIVDNYSSSMFNIQCSIYNRGSMHFRNQLTNQNKTSQK
jgi:hypothetical protein